MPQRPDVGGFIAADLPRLASLLGANLSRGVDEKEPSVFLPGREPACIV